MKIFSKKNIYLDNAGCTPCDIEILKKINNIEKKFFSNPSAIHTSGVQAQDIISKARDSVAHSLNAHSDEIFFTGSGTESIALAILGTIYNFHEQNKDTKILPHIVTSNIEHSAVLENCKILENRGLAEVTYVECDENGIIDPKEVKKALKENTILVSIMYANNEIGTIQPIQEIAKEVRHFRKNKSQSEKDNFEKSSGQIARHFQNNLFLPVLHTDACQAMNYLFTENIEKLGVDMLSFNSSKIYGPKGVGCLYKKRSVTLAPIYAGGGQENNLRSGTENVAGIFGLSQALLLTNKIKEKESARLIAIRDYSIDKLLALGNKENNLDSKNYEIILNGSKENRLPNNINISVLGISSELLVIELDSKGIQVSERSACSSEKEGNSHVVEALRSAQNKKLDETSGALRITLGRSTTKKDIDTLVKTIAQILEKYKKWK